MGVGGLGHLAEAEIDAFGEEHVEQADLVVARGAGAQMDEGVREADIGFDLHQDVGDARLREAFVEVQDQLVDSFRRLGGEPVDVQAAVTNDATRYGSGPSCLREPLQAVCHPCLSVGKPHAGVERYGQCGIGRGGRQRHQGLCRVAMTPGARQPQVAGPEAVAQMGQDGNLP